jgi:hypothetical protein
MLALSSAAVAIPLTTAFALVSIVSVSFALRETTLAAPKSSPSARAIGYDPPKINR